MAAMPYTGADGELAEILDDAWTSGAPSGVLDMMQIYAWRDAAVARHLSEAGAVHPAVHTPTRVMQWLERQGWKRYFVTDSAIGWELRVGEHFVHVGVPVDGEDCHYARDVREVLDAAAEVADVPLPQVLAEVAAMPEEWSW